MSAQSPKSSRHSQWANKQFKVYVDEPVRSEYMLVRSEILRTGRPENVAELYFGPVIPEDGFKFLVEFDFDPKLRKDGTLAFCPCCNRINHYHSGGLVYVPSVGGLAAVGGTCLGKEYLEQVDAKKRNDRAEAQRDYLMETLPYAKLWRAPLEALRPSCLAVHDLQEGLRRRGSGALKHLRDSTRGDDKTLRLGDDSFGVLIGNAVLNKGFYPTKKLNELIQSAGRYTQIENDDEIIEFVAGIKPVDLTKSFNEIQKFRQKFYDLKSQIKNYLDFFSQENIENINKWANDPRNTFNFDITLSATRFGRRFEIKSTKDNYSVILPKELEDSGVEWPAI